MVPTLSRGAADVQQRKEIVSACLLFRRHLGGCLIFGHIDTHTSKACARCRRCTGRQTIFVCFVLGFSTIMKYMKSVWIWFTIMNNTGSLFLICLPSKSHRFFWKFWLASLPTRGQLLSEVRKNQRSPILYFCKSNSLLCVPVQNCNGLTMPSVGAQLFWQSENSGQKDTEAADSRPETTLDCGQSLSKTW